MTAIQEKLLLYDDLSSADQEEVTRYVQAHPEWASVLAEVRALHALLGTGRTAAPDATAVAAHVLARALDGTPTPERAATHARIEAALVEDPTLARQARAMHRALERLAAEADDPVAHFEHLTGRRLAPVSVSAGSPPARVLPWASQPLRFALAACLALGVLYGALTLAGPLAQPERARLADLGGLPNDYEGLQLRGEASAGRTADRYALALEALAAARSTTFGLFPHYDDDALDAVAVRLREVVNASGPGSWEGAEALYALGRLRLYQGQDEEAVWAFQSVVAHDGPHASEARRTLAYLQRVEMEEAP